MKRTLFIIATSLILLPGCLSVKGDWNYSGLKFEMCKPGKNNQPTACKTLVTVPGKLYGCTITAKGRMKFSHAKKGTYVKDVKLTLRCPYNPEPIVRKMQQHGRYEVVKKGKKLYLDIWVNGSRTRVQMQLARKSLALRMVKKGYVKVKGVSRLRLFVVTERCTR